MLVLLNKVIKMNSITVNSHKEIPIPYTGIVKWGFATFTYLNNIQHSFNDEPSATYNNGDRSWHFNGKLHRVGYMAVIYNNNGSGGYYLDGKRYGGLTMTSRTTKDYWRECWEKYRTPQNELHLMANLLAAK